MTTPENPVKIVKENELREMYRHLSKPQPTLKEALGENYESRVSDTDISAIKKVQRYDNDPDPEEVRLDENGRVLQIVGRHLKETFTYDEGGYLSSHSLTENAGQGWDRRYSYRPGEDGREELARLEVTRYECDNPGKIGRTQMKRGKQIGEVQIVNFDSTGQPDSIIPLWIYAG